MKRLVFSIIVFLLAGFILAEKVATFPQLIKPFYIMTDDTHLIITDGPTINTYSLKDYTPIKRFGRAGEGPQEFKLNKRRSAGSVHIYVHPDYILANSLGKVSYFTIDGKFIKERPTNGSPGIRFQPLGNQFVGEGFVNEDNTYYSIRNIYGADFKRGKELYRRKSFSQPEGDMNPFYMTSPIMQVYGDHIYINDAEELKLHVFDAKGDKLSPITCDYKPLPVTEEYKAAIMNWYRTYPSFKDLYNLWKDRLKFPKYRPSIRWFNVVDQKVYVLTNKKDGDKSEFIIFDLEGKLLKRVMVLLKEKDERLFCPYTIKNGKIFQLIENGDEEEWELYVTAIQ